MISSNVKKSSLFNQHNIMWLNRNRAEVEIKDNSVGKPREPNPLSIITTPFNMFLVVFFLLLLFCCWRWWWWWRFCWIWGFSCLFYLQEHEKWFLISLSQHCIIELIPLTFLTNGSCIPLHTLEYFSTLWGGMHYESHWSIRSNVLWCLAYTVHCFCVPRDWKMYMTLWEM